METSPIIDTHVHFWDPDRLSCPWLTGVPAINRRFTPEEYRSATARLPITGIVFVQADVAPQHSRAEVEWVAELARSEPRIGAIVAFAPLEEGEAVAGTLEELSGQPLVRGIRRLIQSEPDPAFCLRDGFVAGVRALARYDLSFDICIRSTQLESAVELVRTCPGVRFILDHIGKPDIAGGELEPWMSLIAQLAALPNVTCKLSGLVTEAHHGSWTSDDLRPYIEHVIECFGFDRLMYGSDWPVVTLAADYDRWAATLQAEVAGCSATERRKLFHDNAKMTYRFG